MQLQSDNGGVFKKHVKKYCVRNKIKIIRCCPYSHKAHGKVERSHHVLQSKIYFDMLHQKRTGVNWVKNLPDYMKSLNNEKREELSWKSSFEIYYGRTANELGHDGKCFPADIETLSTRVPTENNSRQQAKQMNNWRKSAKAADDRMAKVKLKKHTRKNTQHTIKMKKFL